MLVELFKVLKHIPSLIQKLMNEEPRPMLQEKDHLELLKLLARYDTLLEQLQRTMSEGFSQLGRANYHNKDSLRGRYGSDYWNNSYEGHLRAQIDENGVSIGQVEGREYTSKEVLEDEKFLRRRGAEKSKRNINLQKDPITMFGGALSTPTSLRQSQSHFKGSIPLMVELINCRRRIESIATTSERIRLNT